MRGQALTSSASLPSLAHPHARALGRGDVCMYVCIYGRRYGMHSRRSTFSRWTKLTEPGKTAKTPSGRTHGLCMLSLLHVGYYWRVIDGLAEQHICSWWGRRREGPGCCPALAILLLPTAPRISILPCAPRLLLLLPLALSYTTIALVYNPPSARASSYTCTKHR